MTVFGTVVFMGYAKAVLVAGLVAMLQTLAQNIAHGFTDARSVYGLTLGWVCRSDQG
jgi:hypothetical protein